MNRLEEFSQKRANVVSQGEGEYTIKAPYKMNKPLQVRAHIPSVVDLLRFDANPDPDPTTSFTILQYWEIQIFLSLIHSSASLHCFFVLVSVISFIIFNILDIVLGKSIVKR